MNGVDLVVVGSGPAGYSAALEGSKIGLRVLIVEKLLLGGTCLNIGCIPSKFFLHLSYVHYLSKKYKNALLLHSSLIGKNYSSKKKLLLNLRNGLRFLFKKYSVGFIEGRVVSFNQNKATFMLKNNSLEGVNFNYLVLSIGSKPSNRYFTGGLGNSSILSSNEALDFKNIPKSVVIVGAGAIGIELATIYKSLGSDVTVVEFSNSAATSFDREISNYFTNLNTTNFKVLLGSKVSGIFKANKSLFLVLDKDNSVFSLKTSKVIVCIGRTPNKIKNGLNLIRDNRGFYIVNKRLQTSFKNIFIIGDAVYGPMLAHKAEREGSLTPHTFTNKKFRGLNYGLVPNVIYSNPEISSVGLTERELLSLNISFFSKNNNLSSNGRALSVGDTRGFFKLSVCPYKGRLLGAQAVNKSSSDIITITSVFMFYKGTLFDIINTVFPHPTLNEWLYNTATYLIEDNFNF